MKKSDFKSLSVEKKNVLFPWDPLKQQEGEGTLSLGGACPLCGFGCAELCGGPSW